VKTQGRFWTIAGPFTIFLVLGAVFISLGKSYGMSELLSALGQVRVPRTKQDVRKNNWRAGREQRLAEREQIRTAGNNTAGTSSSGNGAAMSDNSSQDGTTQSRGADMEGGSLPRHISNVEKINTPSTDRGSGIGSYTLAQSSKSGQASPQQTPTDEGPQQQVPDPASRSSNGWWNRLFWSRRARPRTNESRV
jgi:hypothetical protein